MERVGHWGIEERGSGCAKCQRIAQDWSVATAANQKSHVLQAKVSDFDNQYQSIPGNRSQDMPAASSCECSTEQQLSIVAPECTLKSQRAFSLVADGSAWHAQGTANLKAPGAF